LARLGLARGEQRRETRASNGAKQDRPHDRTLAEGRGSPLVVVSGPGGC
jgi:hypothetical protein